MTVSQLKQRLNGWPDNAPVLVMNNGYECNELRQVEHDRRCEWVEQQMKDVCVLSSVVTARGWETSGRSNYELCNRAGENQKP